MGTSYDQQQRLLMAGASVKTLLDTQSSHTMPDYNDGVMVTTT
jgi:hypothetical protein